MNNLNFKDIVAKVKGLPTKTKNIIFLLIGIFIFLAAYMLGFQKIQEKTAVVQEEAGKQSAYVAELKNYFNNIQTYEKGIQESKDYINDTLSHLPRGISTEEVLMYVKKANEAVNADFKSISLKDPSPVRDFACVVEDKSVQMSGYQVDTNFSTEMTYPQFKDFLDYIYEGTEDITFIDTVSLVYNPESATLSTTCNISQYYVTYEGAEYVPESVPGVNIGTSNPFGTGGNS